MGNPDKRRGGDDWTGKIGGGTDEHGSITQSSSNESREGTRFERRKGKPGGNVNGDGGFEYQRTTEERNRNNDLDTYLQAFENLNDQIIASQKAMTDVQLVYNKQKRAIQKATETRTELDELKKLHNGVKTTLREFERDKDEEIAKKMADMRKKIADMEEDRETLKRAKEKAAKDRKELEEQKLNHKRQVQKREEDQNAKLLEQRTKLDKDLQEKFRKRVEKMESDTKQQKDEDNKTIEDLETKTKDLTEKIKDQQSKLRQAESRCKDMEDLKLWNQAKADAFEKELKNAEDEFELNSETPEFYIGKFVEIHNKIQELAQQYMKELPVENLDAIHHKLEKADPSFSSVPISNSPNSKELRVIHAQRVISSELQATIWQPFSFGTTLQDPKHVALLSRISEGLAKDARSSSGSQRAARTCMALAMRGLQSQPTMSLSSSSANSSPPRLISRAEQFADNVMAVLSILVEISQHINFRNDLLKLAASAMSVWDIVQTDQREIIVNPILNPEEIKGWRKGKPAADNEVIVMFPSITAWSYSRIADTGPTGVPGSFNSGPEWHIQETRIHNGAGLGAWSTLVIEGEEEEEDRREKEESKRAEERARELEEQMQKLKQERLEKSGTGHARKSSHNSRRESITTFGSGPSSPSAVWSMAGGQKIKEDE